MSDKYQDGEETTAARLMFGMAGVTFRKFTLNCSKIVTDFDSINSSDSEASVSYISCNLKKTGIVFFSGAADAFHLEVTGNFLRASSAKVDI